MRKPIRDAADIQHLESLPYDDFIANKSPFALIRAVAQRQPNAPAIRYVVEVGKRADDRVVSYAQFLTQIHRAAQIFRHFGVGELDAVAVMVPNSPGGQAALWGAQLAGRVCPINPMLRPTHIAQLIDASGCKLVVVLGENDEIPLWQTLVPGLRVAGMQLPILDCEGDPGRDSAGSDGNFEALCASDLAVDVDIGEYGDEHSIAAFYHTGGTTGSPKLVQHTRINEAHVAHCAALMFDFNSNDCVVNGFPLFHVAGAFVFGLSALSAGAELVIPGRLGMRNSAFIDSFWQQVERYQITTIASVPTVISALNQVNVDADISSLRMLLTGGSPLPTELAQFFEDKTATPVRNILGMTESAGIISTEPLHAPRIANSCGFALPYSEVVAMAEPGDGTSPANILAHGETGILAVRGPNVSPGYSNPALGRQTFLDQGWLSTGDIGYVDHEGRIFISGREKDIIIRGAHNLDPQSIEDAFLSHHDVVSAAAVGMPDAYAGELPVVFVSLRGNAACDESQLLAHARERIEEPAALPKRVAILDELPVTPVGKIFKPALRNIAAQWAIERAAEKAGVSLADYHCGVNENGQITLTASESQLSQLRSALVGMPAKIDFLVSQ